MQDADEMGLKSISFPNKASWAEVRFSADGDWYITVPEEVPWITVSPSAGFSSGELVTVRVNVLDNPTYSSRKQYLSIVCNNREQKAQIRVFQDRTFFLKASVNKSLVNKKGGEFRFSVESNGAWGYEIQSAGSSWLREVVKGESEFILSAGQLTTALENSATVIVKSLSDKELRWEIPVFQKDLELFLKGKSLRMTAAALDVLLDVSAVNISAWDVMECPAWVLAEKSDMSHLKLSVTENKTGHERSGTVKISSPDDETLVSSMDISQLAVSAPVADLLDIVFAADGKASDVSPSALAVETIPDPSMLSIERDGTYGVYAPTFGFPLGGGASKGFYRMSLPASVKEIMNAEGFTMEAVLKLGAPLNGKGTKPFSAHFNARGTGFAVSSGTNAAPNQMNFLTVNASPVNAYYAQSMVTPEPNVYYDVVGTWNRETRISKIYINGKLIARSENRTEEIGFREPHIMTIGGSPVKSATGKKIENAWNGQVLHPRIFKGALDDATVEALYLHNLASHCLFEED